MNAALPKVAICFPSMDMVHADFALALAGLCNSTAPIETPLINNKSSIVAIARNDGVRKAQEFGADYILFLDSDMIFPRTTLHRLLLHRKDIVGATYSKRVRPFPILGAALEPCPTFDAQGTLRDEASAGRLSAGQNEHLLSSDRALLSLPARRGDRRNPRRGLCVLRSREGGRLPYLVRRPALLGDRSYWAKRFQADARRSSVAARATLAIGVAVIQPGWIEVLPRHQMERKPECRSLASFLMAPKTKTRGLCDCFKTSARAQTAGNRVHHGRRASPAHRRRQRQRRQRISRVPVLLPIRFSTRF